MLDLSTFPQLSFNSVHAVCVTESACLFACLLLSVYCLIVFDLFVCLLVSLLLYFLITVSCVIGFCLFVSCVLCVCLAGCLLACPLLTLCFSSCIQAGEDKQAEIDLILGRCPFPYKVRFSWGWKGWVGMNMYELLTCFLYILHQDDLQYLQCSDVWIILADAWNRLGL